MPNVIPLIIYGLCVLTSAGCSLLLVRQYCAVRAPLLVWSSACFLLLALNNLVVVVDLLILADTDLRVVRHLLSLGAALTMLIGFIWDGKE